MAKVHARYLLLKNKSTGVDDLVDALLLGEDKQLLAKFDKTKEIYNSLIKKGYVEACLMASPDLNKISDLVEIPVEIISLYRSMFFNIEGYDKLSLLEVVELAATPEERGMKIWALSQGLDFVAWRLGKAVALNPVDGLQELFTLSVFKSKEALFSGNAAESSKEATKWTKLSMDLARLLKAWVMDSDAAKKDIEIALESISPDFKGFDSLGEKDEDESSDSENTP